MHPLLVVKFKSIQSDLLYVFCYSENLLFCSAHLITIQSDVLVKQRLDIATKTINCVAKNIYDNLGNSFSMSAETI